MDNLKRLLIQVPGFRACASFDRESFSDVKVGLNVAESIVSGVLHGAAVDQPSNPDTAKLSWNSISAPGVRPGMALRIREVMFNRIANQLPSCCPLNLPR